MKLVDLPVRVYNLLQFMVYFTFFFVFLSSPRQWGPGAPLPSHFHQLLQENPTAFPGQQRETFSPASPGFSPGSSPSSDSSGCWGETAVLCSSQTETTDLHFRHGHNLKLMTVGEDGTQADWLHGSYIPRLNLSKKTYFRYATIHIFIKSLVFVFSTCIAHSRLLSVWCMNDGSSEEVTS